MKQQSGDVERRALTTVDGRGVPVDGEGVTDKGGKTKNIGVQISTVRSETPDKIP